MTDSQIIVWVLEHRFLLAMIYIVLNGIVHLTKWECDELFLDGVVKNLIRLWTGLTTKKPI